MPPRIPHSRRSFDEDFKRRSIHFHRPTMEMTQRRSNDRQRFIPYASRALFFRLVPVPLPRRLGRSPVIARILNAALLFCILANHVSLGQEEGAVLPQPYPVSRYQEVWENSPFSRIVVEVASPVIRSSFGRGLALQGLIDDQQNGPIAYVRDIETEAIYVVTKERHPSHPFRIVSAVHSPDPRNSKVLITDGAESAQIGYDEGSYTKKISRERSERQAPSKGGNGARSSTDRVNQAKSGATSIKDRGASSEGESSRPPSRENESSEGRREIAIPDRTR